MYTLKLRSIVLVIYPQGHGIYIYVLIVGAYVGYIAERACMVRMCFMDYRLLYNPIALHTMLYLLLNHDSVYVYCKCMNYPLPSSLGEQQKSTAAIGGMH